MTTKINPNKNIEMTFFFIQMILLSKKHIKENKRYQKITSN